MEVQEITALVASGPSPSSLVTGRTRAITRMFPRFDGAGEMGTGPVKTRLPPHWCPLVSGAGQWLKRSYLLSKAPKGIDPPTTSRGDRIFCMQFCTSFSSWTVQAVTHDLLSNLVGYCPARVVQSRTGLKHTRTGTRVHGNYRLRP